MKTFFRKFRLCAGVVLCVFFLANVSAVNADNRKVVFSVASDAGDKYEIVFSVPPLLTCGGYLEDLARDQTFKNAYNFSLAQPDAGDIFVNIIFLQGVTKESITQMMAAPKKQGFKDYKTTREVKKERLFGYSYMLEYADVKKYMASASIYLDDKFFIVISMDNISLDNAEKLLEDFFSSLDNSVVRKKN